MQVISQRELRNDNAAVMRGVEAGETYTVTRRGVPVALITPFDSPLCMTCGTKMRPAGSCYVCEGCGSTSGCS